MRGEALAAAIAEDRAKEWVKKYTILDKKEHYPFYRLNIKASLEPGLCVRKSQLSNYPINP